MKKLFNVTVLCSVIGFCSYFSYLHGVNYGVSHTDEYVGKVLYQCVGLLGAKITHTH